MGIKRSNNEVVVKVKGIGGILTLGTILGFGTGLCVGYDIRKNAELVEAEEKKGETKWRSIW